MCGIAGIFDLQNNRIANINSMISSLKHRGPDNIGKYIDIEKGVYLAHSRLSILDLSSSGNQPMISRSERYVIVYNGEIYNHIELRKKLNQYEWKGSSDTETILALIENLGLEKTINLLTGMFAFAILDKKDNSIYLVRDRFGEKPLYYSMFKKNFFFGSELKSFSYCNDIDFSINENSLASFMRFGYISSPDSIYKNIKKLPQGKYIKFNLSDFTVIEKTYWSVLNNVNYASNNLLNLEYNEIEKKLEDKLSHVIKNQMLSDVPIGTFLSGGIDSSLVTLLMQKNEINKIKTFTIGFKEDLYDEARYAKKIAHYIGTDHNELYLSHKEAIDTIPYMASTYSEPFADPSQIPTYLVSKFASNQIKVALTGDGADEIFGGYNRYVWLNKISKFPFMLRLCFSKLIKTISPKKWDLFFKLIENFLPKIFVVSMPGHKIHKLSEIIKYRSKIEVYEQMISFWNEPNKLLKNIKENKDYLNHFNQFLNLNSFEESMMAYDTLKYLTDDILCKVDRASMHFSLETRTPYLDHELFSLVWKIPIKYKLDINSGERKIILKNILGKYIPKELYERPKMGFGIPLEDWLRGPLKSWMLDLLSKDTLSKNNYIDHDYIFPIIQEHLSGRRNWQYHIWNLLMFQSWYLDSKIK